MPDRFDKVSDQIFRGGKPSPKDLHILSDVFNIKRIISLDGKIGDLISPIVEQLGMDHVIIPVMGKDDPETMNYLKNNISKLLTEKLPVYIHCRHGSDRTGIAIALHRIQNEDWAPQEALEEAIEYQFGDKLDEENQEYYTSIIMSFEDSNNSLDGTIVSYMHDSAEQSTGAPAMNPHQSFAPRENIPMNGLDGNVPLSGIHNENTEVLLKDPMSPADYLSHQPYTEVERKRELARMYLDNIKTKIPSSGQYYERPGGMSGVGPVEPQFFLYH